MSSFFPYATYAHVVGSAGFVLTTWLATYLAAHKPRSFPSRLAILSLFALSGYFLHVVLCMFLPAEQIGHLWRRFMGWFALLPLPLWLHLTSTLLPPEQQARQRLPIRLAYVAVALLSAAWIFGSWSFSRTTLLPPELIWPIVIFVTALGAATLINIWGLCQRAADHTLRLRYSLLGAVVLLLMGWILYWPVTANWLQLSWSPTTGLAVGDSLPLTGSFVLAYTIAYHNAFMAGRWVKRDFFFHAVTVGAFTGLYLLTLLGAQALARVFGFDVPALTLIAVVGLALSTHLLADRARGIGDSLFFKQLEALPGEMSHIVREGPLGAQLAALVNRLRDLTGASIVCVALYEDEKLVVKASTDRERIGRAVPVTTSTEGPAPALAGHKLEPGTSSWDCLMLAEPIRVNEQDAGYLLLGARGVGEEYGRVDRMWISALAAHLGIALEYARRREETTRLISELSAEAEDLAAQELRLRLEFGSVLSGSPPRINPQELREAVYACNRPDRLAEILAREESTLAALPYIAYSNAPPVVALQQQLAMALDAISPAVLPSLESLRNRAMRSKRRRHLPTSAADYHTLRLIMDGYTHEAIAEMLEVSPRQVRNYLDRAIGSLKAFLEQDAENREAEIAAKLPQKFLANS